MALRSRVLQFTRGVYPSADAIGNEEHAVAVRNGLWSPVAS